MRLKIKGVEAPAIVRPNTPFSVSFKICWLTIHPWKKAVVGFKLFTNRKRKAFTSYTFTPGWFWGKMSYHSGNVLMISKPTTIVFDVGRIKHEHHNGG